MPFVKEFRKTTDPFPEWEYLNSIGARNMFGQPIKKWTTELVVDREKNYYLISQGHTNPDRDNSCINYYALCINDSVINMEVEEEGKGRASNKTIERIWIIKKIKFAANWTFDLVSKDELRKIIMAAFVTETYNELITPECVKTLIVDIVPEF